MGKKHSVAREGITLLLRHTYILLACLCLAVGSAIAHPVVPLEHHDWARFKPGAWKKVRLVTEDFDAAGRIKGKTSSETTTTLVQVTDREVVLRVDVTLEIDGQSSRRSRIVKTGLCGEKAGQVVDVRELGSHVLNVGGRNLRTRVTELTVKNGKSQQISRLYYSPEVAPYVLKRVASYSDGVGETNVETKTLAVDVPHYVLDGVQPAAQVETTQTSTSGKRVTREYHCRNVPGSVVSHRAEETGPQGRIIQRSQLSLLEFGGQLQSDRSAVRRSRNRRFQRFSRRGR